jgi:hypothetical protein
LGPIVDGDLVRVVGGLLVRNLDGVVGDGLVIGVGTRAWCIFLVVGALFCRVIGMH